jgi:hypothetical protein
MLASEFDRALESDFIDFANVRALFDFNHFEVRHGLESVTTSNEEYDISFV